MSVDLPEPDTPVTQTNRPTGSSSVTSFRLLPRRAGDRQHPLRRRARGARAGIGICRCPARYWPVSECGARRISSGVPCATTCAAVLAGARAHVDDVVGGEDRILVVLDDDDAVAEVAQVLERRRAAARCRAGAGRSTARRARTSRRSGPSRSATRGGCAAPRRPTAFRPSGRATGSRGRRCSGTAAATDDLLDDLVGDRRLVARRAQRREERACASFSGSAEIS